MEEEIVLIEENDVEEISIEEENYSGKPYELPIASKDVLGGIKVGENLTIDEDGTLNAQAGGSNEEDTGWLDGTPAVGEWATFRYRKIGNKVIFQGRIGFLFPSTNLLLGSIPVEYAPDKQMFTYGFTAGTSITRFNITTEGKILLSYAYDLINQKEIIDANWYHFYFEYYLD